MVEPMVSAESVLALTERLRKRAHLARRDRSVDHATDLRAATFYLRRFAALLIAEEAKNESDPARRRRLVQESSALWCSHD
jgi:hypothetical protein